MNKYLAYISLLFFTITSPLFSQSLDLVFDRATELTLQQDYVGALQMLDAPYLTEHDSLAAQVFKATILMSAFDDLGDTLTITFIDSMLTLTEKRFDLLSQNSTLDTSGIFWYNMLLLQKAYCLELQGSSISAALQIRTASRALQQLNTHTDAGAFASIYFYYVDNSLSWVPFTNPQVHIPYLLKGSQQSRWFKTFFTISLCWVYYEEKRYGDAIALLQKMLLLYPNHRVLNQTLADMYLAKGDLVQARTLYIESVTLYSQRSPGSVRELCAYANLMIIARKQQNRSDEQLYRSLILQKHFNPLYRWLPPTLIESLEPFKVIY